MATLVSPQDEPRWEGVREVMTMSGPIILGSLSYTVMGFVDRIMVSTLGPDALAAVGSADIASYTLSTLFMGVISVVATFAAQCFGKGDRKDCARYCWQGLYLSLFGILFALFFYLLSGPLFWSMRHTPEVTALELVFFRVRLLGYFFVGAMAALAGFFQAVNRPAIPMYSAIAGNVVNLVLNYVLIFGHWGFPKMGISGSATATVIAMAVQTLLLLLVFLGPGYHRSYATRSTWALDIGRCRELISVGMPAAMAMFLDVANWWIWISFIIGLFGPVQMAANTIALSFNSISFMPVLGMHHGIAAVVGQWIGRGDNARARIRTHTALKIAMIYMVGMGLITALFGGVLTRLLFPGSTPEVVALTRKLLILAAMFQAFDAVNIVLMGALRGAGDTRWMMWVTGAMSYGFCLPFSLLLSLVLGMETFGAWIGATIFIFLLSIVLFRRFEGGRWRGINIFTQTGIPPTIPGDA